MAKLFKEIDNIRSGDIVLFTDARNDIAMHLQEYTKLNSVDIFSIGIWNDGIWNVTGMYYNSFQRSRKAYVVRYEKHLANIYNINITTTQKHQKDFTGKIFKPATLMNLPFEYLKIEYGNDKLMTSEIAFNVKSNPYTKNASQKMIGILQKELTEYNFIDLQQIKNNFYLQTKYILKSAMALINMQELNLNPSDYYHALCLGALPLTIKSQALIDMGINIGCSPKLIKPPFINFIRNRKEFLNTIKSYIENYQENKIKIFKQFDPHYTKDNFISLITNL